MRIRPNFIKHMIIRDVVVALINGRHMLLTANCLFPDYAAIHSVHCTPGMANLWRFGCSEMEHCVFLMTRK